MLAIRLQRLGRKKVPVYRVAVQDSRLHPSSGRVVTYLGSYDPHSKVARLDKEKIELYLKNGAQPTPRVVSILKSEKIALPKWVAANDSKKRTFRNPEKLRKNRPADEAAPVEEPKAEVAQEEAPVVAEEEQTAEQAPEEAKTEASTEEPAEESKEDTSDESAPQE